MVHTELCQVSQFKNIYNEKFKNRVVKISYQPSFDDFAKDKNENYILHLYKYSKVKGK